jgi:ribosomal-protein-alanine N-acetyltransferase
MREGWPVRIPDFELALRPLRFRDKSAWDSVRAANREWLAPWEATRPEIDPDQVVPSFYGMVSFFNREARAGRSLAFGIWIRQDGVEYFAGQITLGGIVMGAYRGAHIGYWIDQRFANRGYATRAVRMLTQYAFSDLKLHRIEINMRPENLASTRVAQKSGYSFEGVRPRYLHIDGQWRDHLTYICENIPNPEI